MRNGGVEVASVEQLKRSALTDPYSRELTPISSGHAFKTTIHWTLQNPKHD